MAKLLDDQGRPRKETALDRIKREIAESADTYSKSEDMTDEQFQAFDEEGEPLMSRYAEKEINPNFYRTVSIADAPTFEDSEKVKTLSDRMMEYVPESAEYIFEKAKIASTLPSGIMFYLCEVKPLKCQTEIAKYVKEACIQGNLLLKNLVVNFNDREGSIARIEEVMNNSRFVKWAGDFKPTDQKNYNTVWDKKNRDEAFTFSKQQQASNMVNETRTSTYTRLNTSWSAEDAQDMSAMLPGGDKLAFENHKAVLLNELNSKDANLMIPPTKSIEDLEKAMKTLGYTLSDTTIDPNTFKAKKFWVKSNKASIGQRLKSEWEVSTFDNDSEVTDGFIKVIGELVDIELNRFKYISESDRENAKLDAIAYVIEKRHHYKPPEPTFIGFFGETVVTEPKAYSSIVSYFKLVIRSYLLRSGVRR